MALVAIDTNILIYFVERSPEFGELSKQLLGSVAEGQTIAIASELVYLEVLAHNKLSPAELLKTQTFIERSGVNLKPIDKSILLEAAKLRRLYATLKTLDAIHLAAAVLHKCDYFVTNDQKLLNKKIPGIKFLSLANLKQLKIQPIPEDR